MYGKVGPQNLSSGVRSLPTLDERGNIIAAVGGKYTEATLAGRMFAVANQAATITTAGVATTYTGLCVYNPLTSGKNLVICGFNYGSAAVMADATMIGIMAGTGGAAATASIAIQNRLTGGPASKAYADAAVVFTVAPVLHQIVCNAGTVATTAGFSISPPQCIELDGSLVIGPGGHVSAFTSIIVDVASLSFGFLWEEVDV